MSVSDFDEYQEQAADTAIYPRVCTNRPVLKDTDDAFAYIAELERKLEIA